MVRFPPGVVGTRPHAPGHLKRIPWAVCRACGLVYLRNERTRQAIERGCYIYADEKKDPARHG